MMRKLYFRDAAGNVSEHELYAIDARHALTFPHEWSETPDGFTPKAEEPAPAPVVPTAPAAEPPAAPDREPAPAEEPPAAKKAKN